MESAAGHELPHAARSGARQRQRLETRFGLRQVDQILRDTDLLQGRGDHVAVAP